MVLAMADTAKEIRVGVQIRPNHVSWKTMESAWAYCDHEGVDSIWTFDHFFPIDGDLDGSSFECWTTLAAMGPQTEHAQIGALVTCYSYRNINLLADMARTVSHACGGRFILGLGAGWLDKDYEEYGFEKLGDAERIRGMQKSISLIEERYSKLNPPPVNPIPLLIGGLGQKLTLSVTAQYADMWNGWGTPAEISHLNKVLDDHCRRFDRNPDEIERTVALFEYADEATYDEYLAAGASHIIIVQSGPKYQFEELGKLLSWRDSRNELIGKAHE